MKSHTLTEVLGRWSLALANCPKTNSGGSSGTRETVLLGLSPWALCRRGSTGIPELAHSAMSRQELCLRNVDSDDSCL